MLLNLPYLLDQTLLSISCRSRIVAVLIFELACAHMNKRHDSMAIYRKKFGSLLEHVHSPLIHELKEIVAALE